MWSFGTMFHVIVLTCALLFLVSQRVNAKDPTLVDYKCLPGSASGSGSINYQSNLRALLANLSSNTSSFAIGFHTATIESDASNKRLANKALPSEALTYKASPSYGLISNAPVRRGCGCGLHGLFLCRPDMSADVCKNCVDFAVNYFTIFRQCHGAEGIVWYEECMMHYSHQDFFGSGQTEPRTWLWTNGNFSNPDDNNNNNKDYGSNLSLIYKLVHEAQRSDKLYAAGSDHVTKMDQTRYGLVQCARDVNATTCGSCLDNLTSSIGSCCKGKIGWQILGASCMMRYEAHPFFNLSANISPSPSPEPALHPREPGKPKRRRKVWIVVAIALSSAVAVAVLAAFCYYKRRAKKDTELNGGNFLKDLKGKNKGPLLDEGTIIGDHDDGQQMHYLSLAMIATATNNFSDDNKLGEGGFGPVYKGKLPNGTDIAIKRLSVKSTQGLTEFKNEAILIIKLQHRNLVRLLGYCMEKNEKILVYEYMKNMSLDAFLFDRLKGKELDWKKRNKIVHGIAKGLQYLHEDSRLKIIHRDLKASNILLDDEMNPKISDFGTARIFGCKQIEDKTGRIIGTFGYMSPEYAFRGMISEKSDIYSFGVLLLEIISGQRATRLILDGRKSSLIVYAWESWCETKGLDLVDPALDGSYCPSEVMRYVHIALLCVQDQFTDRPTISQVVNMLNTDKELPHPKQAIFTFKDALNNNQDQPSPNHVYSIYEATVTTMEVR